MKLVDGIHAQLDRWVFLLTDTVRGGLTQK